MIKIVKHPENRVECDKCNCIFTFEKEDLHFKSAVEWGLIFPQAVSYNYVICPSCGKRIKMYI